jgi:hypothetical protein
MAFQGARLHGAVGYNDFDDSLSGGNDADPMLTLFSQSIETPAQPTAASVVPRVIAIIVAVLGVLAIFAIAMLAYDLFLNANFWAFVGLALQPSPVGP